LIHQYQEKNRPCFFFKKYYFSKILELLKLFDRSIVRHSWCLHIGVIPHYGCDPIGVAVHIRVDPDAGAVQTAVADHSELHVSHLIHVTHFPDKRTAGIAAARVAFIAPGAELVALHGPLEGPPAAVGIKTVELHGLERTSGPVRFGLAPSGGDKPLKTLDNVPFRGVQDYADGSDVFCKKTL